MEPAVAADVEALLTMRDAAAVWMADRGIRQWVVGEIPIETTALFIERGDYWVVRQGDEITGALRLVWSDVPVWGEQPDQAGYVHSLVIARNAGGSGLGRAMLDWAGDHTLAAGRAFLRLDCVASNAALRDYYARNGFIFVDIAKTSYGPVALWQRSLRRAQTELSRATGFDPDRKSDSTA